MAALQRSSTPGGRQGPARRPAARRTARSASLATADVLRLREAAGRFGEAARHDKGALLAALAGRRLDRPRVLAEYHDALLFVIAYADDPAIAALAEAELVRCADAARDLDGRGHASLNDTGIAWTSVTAALSFDLARWLVTRFPGGADITSLGDGAERLPELLALLLPPLEADAIAAEAASLDLIDRVKGPRCTRLAFLLAQLERLPAPPAVRAQLYDTLTPFVTIAPHGSPASRTFARGLPAAPFLQQGPLVKAVADARAVMAQPLPPARALAADERIALVDVARATLAMLARETDPITWPSVAAVSLHDLGHGLALALYPMAPARRPALDSHTGYLLFRNRVPIAYGGGWPFLGTCRIGINVFPAFRGGESALAFAQVLRVYRQVFGCARFLVEPYQFGAGNAEGLRSGAFWFYWRLGFRPVDPALARLAGTEAARLSRIREARTPLPLMRELTRSDLALDVATVAPAQRVEATDLSCAVSRRIAEAHGADRDAAQRVALDRVRAALGVQDDDRWPEDERAAFASLALLVALVEDLAAWSDADKANCIALMRAKGAADDAPYFRALASHPRLPEALLALAHTR